MDMINVFIDGKEYSVRNGATILEACRSVGIHIPTLCYLKDINEIGACRMCVVEVKGAKSLVAACVYPLDRAGTEIFTHSPEVLKSRKLTLQLLLSTHDKKCLSCVKSGQCEFQQLCKEYGVDDENKFEGIAIKHEKDTSMPHLIRDNNKCVLCRRCVAACDKNQGVAVIGPNERGFITHIGSAFELKLDEVACIACGQCITVCPTGALTEVDDTQKVWDALNDPSKHVVVHAAPSIRATLGEEFGLPIGTLVTGKLAAALRRLGFDKVFDTNFTADLTIMEEANELLERIQNGGTLPMITSCSPGWIKFCEHYYPDLIPNLSSCKSPQQMMGAVIKTYYAEKAGIDPKDIFVVSVMPCTAKKFEIGRDNQAAAGVPDTDVSITTRELARMIKRAGIDFNQLPDEEFDSPMGFGSGAGTIFGATGGVMEAALRTAVATLTGKNPEKVEFEAVRGTAGIKEAFYNVAGVDVKVAVASGTANAKKLLDMVKSGEKNYTFIEIMGCPGGCVNGGGQPFQPASVRNFVDLKALRAAALYRDDENLPVRLSHENEDIKTLYREYFGKPGSEKAHHALHTSYVARKKLNVKK